MTSTCAWVRFHSAAQTGFGSSKDGHIHVHHGELFDQPVDTGQVLAVDDGATADADAAEQGARAVEQLRPAVGEAGPVAAARAAVPASSRPTPTWTRAGDHPQPPGDGKLAFEGELAIVIGRRATHVPLDDAMTYVFGYTCANDVTLADIIQRDPSFPQWVRAKGCDGFCPFGPAIVTGLDPTLLRVRTMLNGEVRQDYPISDMPFLRAETRQPDLARHDAAAWRHDPVRHLGRRRLDEARQHASGRDRRHRHARQHRRMTQRFRQCGAVPERSAATA